MDPDPDPPRAWVLNLDADDELARTGGHTPNAAARRRMQTMAATVAATLVPPDDVWWVPGDPAPAADAAQHVALLLPQVNGRPIDAVDLLKENIQDGIEKLRRIEQGGDGLPDAV